tara:strand:+ start:1213 stop:1479 length:267 start_codon:yes stop_codon:yes gene_type:complete
MINYDYSWSDFVGNIGVVILLTTYYLNVAGKVDSKGWQYNLANLIVAILLGINLYYKPNISSIIIEIVWFVIAAYGLINYRRNSVVKQ